MLYVHQVASDKKEFTKNISTSYITVFLCKHFPLSKNTNIDFEQN